MEPPPRRSRPPFYVLVILGVGLGAAAGALLGKEPSVWLAGHSTGDLGEIGQLVIRLLRLVAVPLIFFAIIDALVKTQISGRSGLKLVAICLMNVSVAFAIGLVIMNTFRPGEAMAQGAPAAEAATAKPSSAPPSATLSPLENLKQHVPESIVAPFANGGSLLSVIFLAVLLGAATRVVGRRQRGEGQAEIAVVEQLVDSGYRLSLQILDWIVQLVPLAVFCTVAMAVGKADLNALRAMGNFLLFILLGLAIHALVYYPLVAWLMGGKTPRRFFRSGADAIVTGLSTNSSLATSPLTLHCLTERLGVSHESARLSACIGTNLNNDGIMLYEAMAAIFLCQAAGMEQTFAQQLGILANSLMVGVGIAGIPEAGYIVLPLVLKSAGLSDAQIAVGYALIPTVDWILARCRSAVNVMGDMVVAILLDAGHKE